MSGDASSPTAGLAGMTRGCWRQDSLQVVECRPSLTPLVTTIEHPATLRPLPRKNPATHPMAADNTGHCRDAEGLAKLRLIRRTVRVWQYCGCQPLPQYAVGLLQWCAIGKKL